MLISNYPQTTLVSILYMLISNYPKQRLVVNKLISPQTTISC